MSLTINETLKWLSSLAILMQVILVVIYILSLFPNLHTPPPPFSPSLISLVVSVDVKHHVYCLLTISISIYSPSSHTSIPPPPPPPPSLISLMVSVGVKHHVYLLTNFKRA